MVRRIEMLGKQFGRLTVISDFSKASDGQVVWHCLCICGGVANVRGDLLRKGISKSCGCFSRESASLRRTSHGMTSSPEYKIWVGMKERCHNDTCAGYKNYGARGISVCPEWNVSFEQFYSDIGPRPSINHSVERIDVNGNYEPSNCKWATKVDQARNRRPKNLGILGVWPTKERTYRVDIGLANKAVYVGTFKDFFEACCARKSAELKFWANPS